MIHREYLVKLVHSDGWHFEISEANEGGIVCISYYENSNKVGETVEIYGDMILEISQVLHDFYQRFNKCSSS